jgi:hypothetical protein
MSYAKIASGILSGGLASRVIPFMTSLPLAGPLTPISAGVVPTEVLADGVRSPNSVDRPGASLVARINARCPNLIAALSAGAVEFIARRMVRGAGVLLRKSEGSLFA